MSENPNAAAGAAGEGGTAPDPKAGGEGAGDNKGAAGGADNGSLASLGEGAAAAAAAGPASWPDDWRERLTNGDEAGMALLKRYPSVDDLYKRVLSQEQIIRRGQHKAAPTLPENATEEQVAEYRKAIGVPETPDGYGLKFAEELKPTEADNELLNGFLADMHRQHVPPGPAKAAFDWYQAYVGRAREEHAASMQRVRHTNEQVLRKEYGADFQRNLGLADEFLAGLPGLAKLVTPFSDVDVLRDVIALARANADEEALYGGDGHGGGKSIDQKILDYQNRRIKGEKLSDQEYAEYERLVGQQLQRNQRRGNRAA